MIFIRPDHPLNDFLQKLREAINQRTTREVEYSFFIEIDSASIDDRSEWYLTLETGFEILENDLEDLESKLEALGSRCITLTGNYEDNEVVMRACDSSLMNHVVGEISYNLETQSSFMIDSFMNFLMLPLEVDDGE